MSDTMTAADGRLEQIERRVGRIERQLGLSMGDQPPSLASAYASPFPRQFQPLGNHGGGAALAADDDQGLRLKPPLHETPRAVAIAPPPLPASPAPSALSATQA